MPTKYKKTFNTGNAWGLKIDDAESTVYMPASILASLPRSTCSCPVVEAGSWLGGLLMWSNVVVLM